MPVYQITLRTPEGEETILCPDDVYILDAAENDSEFYIDENGVAHLKEIVVSSSGNGSHISPNKGENSHSFMRGDYESYNSSLSKSEIDFILSTNQEAFDRMSDQFRLMVQRAEREFNKDKKSYDKAQANYRKYRNNSKYKLSKSDLKILKSAIKKDELKAIEKNTTELSKGLKIVGKLSLTFDFMSALSDSWSKNDWRPIFDQAASFGAGYTVARALSFAAVANPYAILALAALQALFSYYLSSDKVTEWRESFESSFMKTISINNGKAASSSTQ